MLFRQGFLLVAAMVPADDSRWEPGLEDDDHPDTDIGRSLS